MGDDTSVLRVLSIDGGGTRGIYAAEYLRILISDAAKRVGVEPATLDPGKAFHLIVGTSTGGIVACALAMGRPLDRVVQLYREHAAKIFPERIPSIPADQPFVTLRHPLQSSRKIKLLWRFTRKRNELNRRGRVALQSALEAEFGDETFLGLWKSRRIALCLPAVNVEKASAWIFKTPHLDGSRGRDDNCRLVDACMATTAAPIYRSLAAVPSGDSELDTNIFVDGGLWANNPVLVALVEALRMRDSCDRPIEVYSMGTCAQRGGDCLSLEEVDQGPIYWQFGGKAATLGMDAQSHAYDYVARFLAKSLPGKCSVFRFRGDTPPASLLPYLSLDEASPAGLSELVKQARHDADFTRSKANDPNEPESRFLPKFLSAIAETRMVPKAKMCS